MSFCKEDTSLAPSWLRGPSQAAPLTHLPLKAKGWELLQRDPGVGGWRRAAQPYKEEWTSSCRYDGGRGVHRNWKGTSSLWLTVYQNSHWPLRSALKSLISTREPKHQSHQFSSHILLPGQTATRRAGAWSPWLAPLRVRCEDDKRSQRPHCCHMQQEHSLVCPRLTKQGAHCARCARLPMWDISHPFL